ncbi:hemolysin protein [Rhodopirellula baltica SH28]|uniref:Hemolysin protein n=3 Tax=Rhodopirellula TaxID=265488 RepID=M2A3R0_9BACT|nr:MULTISPECIES: hemolysin family protein [Rhodopirellula]EKK03536.1 hemolysin protein [Rhodopirellula baltica SH28]ELP35733.1 hemolysin protein [Rhodopirellula baltica SWK14]EMB13846.1 hemolysin protein [Rhodopirellula europaea 6C]|tara:strand:- start:17078 stop:18370 length:1293 start_codon:yes stop_codon:yes gene_type:complete
MSELADLNAMPLAAVGFVLGSIGGLGSELLDRFAGRSLEIYCRVKKNRDRFGSVLDHQDTVIRAGAYLHVIGSVMFVLFGTIVVVNRVDVDLNTLLAWGIAAAGLTMLTHTWLPNAVTRFASAPLLYHTWPFWRTMSFVMRPLHAPGELLEIISRRLAGVEETEDEDEEQLEDEIRTIVAAGTREGFFAPGVREMIQGVMELHEDTVGHIMTPRVDVNAIAVTATWEEAIESIIETGRTRYPVYEDTIDNVVGVLFVKDLLPYLAGEGLPNKPLLDLCRRPWSVPKDRSVDLLLREFLHSRSHMAIVLDEFQQTAGVVTIEDALEEIVGEIVDESDEEEEFEIRVIDDDTIDVDGRVMIDDVNDLVHWDLPESDDYETVAGWVLHHTGMIPTAGHLLNVGHWEVEVLHATNRKIENMRIRRTNGESQRVG